MKVSYNLKGKRSFWGISIIYDLLLNSWTIHLFDQFSFQTSNSTDKEEVASGGLFDSTSEEFRKALRYASISLGVALFFSLMYEVIRRIRSREKVHQKGKECFCMYNALEPPINDHQACPDCAGKNSKNTVLQNWQKKHSNIARIFKIVFKGRSKV